MDGEEAFKLLACVLAALLGVSLVVALAMALLWQMGAGRG